eukprot:8493-Heterococcus_DN1.PRE.3
MPLTAIAPLVLNADARGIALVRPPLMLSILAMTSLAVRVTAAYASRQASAALHQDVAPIVLYSIHSEHISISGAIAASK